MQSKPVKIGECGGVPVYYDSSQDKSSVYRCRGPVKQLENPGLVYMNWETGKMTRPNGEEWVPEKVEYETKFYVVATEDITEATHQITKLYHG